MAELTDTGTPPPAPDYPPVNDFTAKDVVTEATRAYYDVVFSAAIAGPEIAKKLGLDASLIAFIIKLIGDILTAVLKEVLSQGQPILEQLVSTTSEVLGPGMALLGDLTAVYVNQFGQFTTDGGQRTGAPKVQGVTAVAQGMYDSILAPLEQVSGGADPAQTNAGAKNAHTALGSIVEIRLLTWMVNIISNLTGVGTLKFINSFNECMTEALSARSVERLASKPYLQKFIVDPLTRDLNAAHPITDLSVAQLIKGYVRGGLTVQQLHSRMRQKGYHEQLSADFLIDTVRELAISEVAYLVNQKYWTDEQATSYLTQIGYDAALANVPLGIAKVAELRSIHTMTADTIVSLVEKRRMLPADAIQILQDMGFTTLEIQGYELRWGLLLERFTPLSLGQVKELFAHDLVDATYVQNYLHQQGYSEDDQRLLFLLEFAKAEDRKLAQGTLGAQARFREASLLDAAATAKAKNNQRLADAEAKLAAKKAAVAAFYGQ